MFDLVDIHCHALCDVDDGARNETVMKAMIDIAYRDGIKTICFTPHFKTYEFRDNDDIDDYHKRIDKSFETAQQYALEKYPDMMLYLGNEIMYHNEIISSLSSLDCKSLNGSAYILVEFQPSVTCYDIESAILKILRRGYIPVIAHIERYSALIKKPELVVDLRNMGALMQINSRSITKFKIGKIARFIRGLLKRKQVDIVATDSHDDSFFVPNLSKSMMFVSKHYGESYAEKIFCKNALKVVSNKKFF